MPYYIARVELRGTPSGTDYANLHDAMAKQNFMRTIVIGGQKWELPHAEYVWHTGTQKTANELRDELMSIITSVYANYYLLVSSAADVAGYLEKLS